MLNAEAEMTRPPKASKGKPKETLGHWGVTWKQIVKTVIERHPDIEGQFFTGAGLGLQRIDSDLCEAVYPTMEQALTASTRSTIEVTSLIKSNTEKTIILPLPRYHRF